MTNGEKYILAPDVEQLRLSASPLIYPEGPPPGLAGGEADAALPTSRPEPALSDAAKTDKGEAEVDGTLELTLDSTKAYKATAGRSRRDAGLAIHDNVLIPVIITVMNKAREPFTHLHNWLTKPLEAYEIDGDRRSPENAAALVRYKGQDILDELTANTESHVWPETLLFVPAHLRVALAQVIMTLTLRLPADYHRI